MEAVRRYLAALPPEQSLWVSGLGDAAARRALALLHGALDRRWTAEDLARAVGLSRSAFAERFTRAPGEPPMHYLARTSSEERRGGKECVSTSRSRWSPYHSKKKPK